MPAITPQVRASIGGNSDAPPAPRLAIKAATGMEPPRVPPAQPAAAAPAAQAPQAPSAPVKTGQSDTVEETTPTAAVTLSPQLTALARKQQKLQQEIQAQREREAKWAQEQANYVPKSSIKEKLRTDAAGALKELDLDYEELTRLLLEQQQGADPVNALKADIEKMKADQQQAVSAQYEATLKQYKAEAEAVVAADPKAFFLINKGKHHDVVVQHIVDTWQENPEQVLTVEQAAKEIEEYFREQARQQKALLEELEGPPPAPTPPVPEKKLPNPTRTLTQQVETAPTRTFGQFQHLSMKERIAQAIARSQK